MLIVTIALVFPTDIYVLSGNKYKPFLPIINIYFYLRNKV